jgi:hypothetical protein
VEQLFSGKKRLPSGTPAVPQIEIKHSTILQIEVHANYGNYSESNDNFQMKKLIRQG